MSQVSNETTIIYMYEKLYTITSRLFHPDKNQVIFMSQPTLSLIL